MGTMHGVLIAAWLMTFSRAWRASAQQCEICNMHF